VIIFIASVIFVLTISLKCNFMLVVSNNKTLDMCLLSLSFLVLPFFLETGSHSVAQAGFIFMMLPSQPPEC
jgi:hypothetical protein